MSRTNHLRSAGEEGQKGRTSDKGWQLSFKKSLQQKTSSLFWLKLVPYLTGERISVDMYLDLSSNGRSKNLLPTSIIFSITSLGMSWFTNCTNSNIKKLRETPKHKSFVFGMPIRNKSVKTYMKKPEFFAGFSEGIDSMRSTGALQLCKIDNW